MLAGIAQKANESFGKDDLVARSESVRKNTTMNRTPALDLTGMGPTTEPDEWDTLRAQVLSCTACNLYQTRQQAVFGVGNKHAQWLIIGEAPGADEDRQGEPFVGRAGQLLNNMLRAVGLQREQVYIANILKCRPPQNRDPRPEEVLQCEGYLQRQIALIRPAIILAVGRIAAQNLLKTDKSLALLRGKQFQFGDSNIPLVVTYHPAYLLRTPRDKRKAWQDLLYAQSICSGLVHN
jgi:DNA polymerase